MKEDSDKKGDDEGENMKRSKEERGMRTLRSGQINFFLLPVNFYVSDFLCKCQTNYVWNDGSADRREGTCVQLEICEEERKRMEDNIMRPTYLFCSNFNFLSKYFNPTTSV